MCARLGLDSTGVDISTAAIEAAEQKARQRNLTARFVRRDVREHTDLGESFDTVLDCGLYVHLCDDDADRAAYLRSVQSLTHAGSRYFMLCCRGDSGHHRGHIPDEIAVAFADGWQFDSIGETTLDTATEAEAIPAWLVSLTRSAPDTSGASTVPAAAPSRASRLPRRLRPSRSLLLLGIAAVLVAAAHLGLAGGGARHVALDHVGCRPGRRNDRGENRAHRRGPARVAPHPRRPHRPKSAPASSRVIEEAPNRDAAAGFRNSSRHRYRMRPAASELSGEWSIIYV
jgi:Methyltransferase domain